MTHFLQQRKPKGQCGLKTLHWLQLEMLGSHVASSDTKGLHCATVRVASSSWHTMATCLPDIKLSVTTPSHLPHQGACYWRPRSVLNIMGMESQNYQVDFTSSSTGVVFKLKANLEKGTHEVVREGRVALQREVLFIHDKPCWPYYRTTSREFPEGFV